MPDYRQSTETATTHRRAFAVHLRNPYGRPEDSGIVFEEEDILQMQGKVINMVVGNVGAGFTPSESFPLLDPRTGEEIGKTASHLDVYVLLNSLYINLARKRDEAEAAAAAAAAAASESPAPSTTEGELHATNEAEPNG